MLVREQLGTTSTQILARLELPYARPAALVRRAYFDLVGLPPEPRDVAEFLADPSPNSYERLLDRLLDAPQFGERWGRHWLDEAGYADTYGSDNDAGGLFLGKGDKWRYRDYVIQSLNDDKPYDRFLQEQIAGDVLWPQDEQAIVATGFLAAGPWDFVGQVEAKSPRLRRAARSLDLDDMAIVIDRGIEASAYVIPAVREVGVVNDVVGGSEVAVVIDPATPDRWAVFSRRLDDAVVQLDMREDGLVDVATGTVFDPFVGTGVSGPLADQSLDKLPAFTSFLEDYWTFFPDGKRWPERQ